MMLRHVQELKDNIFTGHQRNKDRIQELEQEPAKCRAENSHLKATSTISDEEVVKELHNILQFS